MPLRLLSNVTLAASPAAKPLTAASTPTFWVLIQVLKDNAGKIYVGDSGITADGLSGSTLQIPVTGSQLPFIGLPAPGNDSINLNEIFIHGDVGLDGVNVQYFEE